jgi:hypothetical protein
MLRDYCGIQERKGLIGSSCGCFIYLFIFGYNRGDLSYDERCVARSHHFS